MTLYIGLMSGTSMDGIDAALVDLAENILLCGITTKYSDDVKTRLEHLLNGVDLTLASLCQLNTLIGKEFAGAVSQILQTKKLLPSDIRAIGSHGQTVCHDAYCSIPYTLQLGCAHTISALTGITVVTDFRTRDLVNGGQGAPFAPLYHQELLGRAKEHIAVVNIGGIANISLIHANEAIQGWDVGPGNCLMDAWTARHQGKPYDAEGSWARQGELIQPLLDQLLIDPFIGLPAPKSIGKEYFSLSWLESHLKKEYKPVDVQKTLLYFTAQTIADSILIKNHIKKVYLCGGGTHNLLLNQVLEQLMPEVKVQSIADAGINPDYLEAMMFAWLAEKTIKRIPLDLSTITGAKCPEILGVVYLGRVDKTT